MFNSNEFDNYVNEYDDLTSESDKKNTYPFAGYKKVLDKIYKIISLKPESKILDLGFGTAKLTSRLYNDGHTIYGQDFSEKMVEYARNFMPMAKLYNRDFLDGLDDNLTKQKYDFIIATYALHHLSDEEKIAFIPKLLDLLKDDGKLLIGDISFENREKLNQVREIFIEDWDDDESYCVYEELKTVFNNLQYEPISFCSGVFTLLK